MWLLLVLVWLVGLVIAAPLLAAVWRDNARWDEEAGSVKQRENELVW